MSEFIKYRAIAAVAKRMKPLDRLKNLYARPTQAAKETNSMLNERETENSSTVFQFFDKNFDKAWSFDEFRDYLKWHTNYSVDDRKISDVFKTIDVNGDERLSLSEFLKYNSLKKTSLPTSDDLDDLFNKCDINNDGLLSLDDLRHILLLLGEDVLLSVNNREHLRKTFASIDGDKDGLINMYEFRRFINSETLRSKSTLKNP